MTEGNPRGENVRKSVYWVTTWLLAVAFLMGGAFDLMRGPQVMEGLSKLGYPAYFAAILGAWKLLGAVALVAPKYPRLKEWAYAGIMFDLTGAAFSHLASGDPAGKLVAPLVLLALTAASWAFRPSDRVLGTIVRDTRERVPATA